MDLGKDIGSKVYNMFQCVPERRMTYRVNRMVNEHLWYSISGVLETKLRDTLNFDFLHEHH